MTIRREEKHGDKLFTLGVAPWDKPELAGLKGKAYERAMYSQYAVIVYGDGGSVLSRQFFKDNQFNAVKAKLAKAISDETGEPVGAVRKRLFETKNIPHHQLAMRQKNERTKRETN